MRPPSLQRSARRCPFRAPRATRGRRSADGRCCQRNLANVWIATKGSGFHRRRAASRTTPNASWIVGPVQPELDGFGPAWLSADGLHDRARERQAGEQDRLQHLDRVEAEVTRPARIADQTGRKA
jgi:hypothetical protein